VGHVVGRDCMLHTKTMRERMRFTTFSIPNVPMTPTQHSINAVTLWGDDSRTNASCASGSMCSMPPAKKKPADTQLARESLRGSERQTKGTSPQPTMRQNIDRADSSRNAVPIGDGTGVPPALAKILRLTQETVVFASCSLPITRLRTHGHCSHAALPLLPPPLLLPPPPQQQHQKQPPPFVSAADYSHFTPLLTLCKFNSTPKPYCS
jgi:hypothetical protein